MACKSCREKQKAAYNILNAVADVATGNAEYVDSMTLNQRVSICLNCPGNHFNQRFQACNICKCFVRAKASFKESECPKKFWSAINE